MAMIDNFFKYYEKLNIVINNNESNTKVAVIIEPRNHKYLVGVIKQTMDKLGDTWNLRIFGSDKNEANIKENIKGTYTFINMRINDFVSPDAYSLFMQSKQFWDKIDEEHILIFQTDSFILSNKYGIPLQYGFIGAYYYNGWYDASGNYIDINAPVKGGCNINGGFSYRSKKAMLDCINKVTNVDIINYRKHHNLNIDYFIDRLIIPEDVFFTNAMAVLDYPIPICSTYEKTECMKFCIHQFNEDSINVNNELISTGNKPFGIHPFDKFNKGVIDRLCIDSLLQTLQSKIQLFCESFQDKIPEQKMAIEYLSGNENVIEILQHVNVIIMENDYRDALHKKYIDELLHEHKFNIVYAKAVVGHEGAFPHTRNEFFKYGKELSN
jgi:hypothetical protein